MQFLQPIILWGLLGISIPILIHLWRGKQGKVIQWAAMRWLSEQESSVAKGVRLENIWVLLLRILMIVLLVLLLSQVFIDKFSSHSQEQIIHLVQPNIPLTEEYKFELQQAIQKGQEVYWANADLSSIQRTDALDPDPTSFDLQASLFKIPKTVTALHLYLNNSQHELQDDYYLSPIKPLLFLGNTELSKDQGQVVHIEDGRVFQVDENGLLDTTSIDKAGRGSVSLKKQDFTYFFGQLSDSERVFIQASLDAIAEVYGFDFSEKTTVEEATLIFDSDLPADVSRKKLYFISDSFLLEEATNVVFFTDPLDFEHAELVQSGQLPEVILEKFLEFSGVKKLDVPLSYTQLQHKFLVDTSKSAGKTANAYLLLLSLFLLCFAAERYFANRQGI
ncbi:BatA domain-containing protein [Algoriphagus sp.]|uniref:BatA domain-containing protein n=1 Tax=Algoriphagus sp. TaxID=1872435 RepID=UPI00327E600C